MKCAIKINYYAIKLKNYIQQSNYEKDSKITFHYHELSFDNMYIYTYICVV